MTTKPSHYTITRKKTSKPDGPMRVVVTAPPVDGRDAGLGQGGTFFFEPGQSHLIPADLAAEFMADAYHAEHFDIEPPLPKKALKEAEAEAEARVEVAGEPPVDPKAVGQAGAVPPKKATTRAK